MTPAVAAASARQCAWLCLLLAWVCFLLPLPGLSRLLGMPLAIVGFLLSLVAMTRAQRGAGLLVVLTAVVLSPLLFLLGAMLQAWLGLGPAPLSGFLLQPGRENGGVQQVTALNMLAAYEFNVDDANAAFRGQRLQVQGQVQSVDGNARGLPIVRLGDPGGLVSVRAVGLDAASVANLRQGQVIELICTGAGDVVGTPRLSECRLTR